MLQGKIAISVHRLKKSYQIIPGLMGVDFDVKTAIF